MDRLKGKVCVVTGGAQGVGYETVKRFAEENPERIYSIDMNEGGYEHPLVTHVKLNICDRAGCEALAARIQQECGHCDVLVNNASITRDAMLWKMTDEQWDAVINVNLKGTFLITQALIPMFREQKRGSIMCISSGSGITRSAPRRVVTIDAAAFAKRSISSSSVVPSPAMPCARI